MTDFVERRSDSHLQVLVEVGIGLCRSRGHEYARQFLRDVQVPESIVERVLKEEIKPKAERRIRHVA
jgi:hypothetical protein